MHYIQNYLYTPMYMYVVYIYTCMSIRDFLFSALINSYSVTYVTIIIVQAYYTFLLKENNGLG